MSNFTYEQKEIATKLETYEWDNVWIEQANNVSNKHVLYIGDSISCGTRKICTSVSDNRLLFDGFGTSKAVDNPFFFDSVSLFAKQLPRCDAVIFNNGLHGWHLDDGAYAEHFDSLLCRFKKLFADVPLMLVLTTSVADTERETRVKARNFAVVELAKKHSLNVIDLYTVSVNNVALRSGDGVHFTSEGYTEFAKTIVSAVEKL